jgi:hypothetical protein
MTRNATHLALILFTASGVVLAQSSTGWRRVGDPPPSPVPAAAPAPADNPQLQQNPEPVDRSDQYGQAAQPGAPAQNAPDPAAAQTPQSQMQMNDRPPAARRPAYGLPAELTVKPGTFVTVRTNQMLSSSHNQVGDTFSATLAQPLVVDGVVLANRGQTVYGRVADVEKQHSDRPSRLKLELTGITLADGTQAGLRSQLVARQGGTTPAGVQAGTVAGTTVAGAAVGSMADWGRGAAIGAGVGAAAGIIGVLLTRNHPTEVYPETALTFEITSPVEVSTARAPQAFRYVGPEDYEHAAPQLAQRPRPVGPPPAYYYGPGYYPYYGYPYSYYPYYWGPSFGVGFVFGGGHYYHGGGRRWR